MVALVVVVEKKRNKGSSGVRKKVDRAMNVVVAPANSRLKLFVDPAKEE